MDIQLHRDSHGQYEDELSIPSCPRAAFASAELKPNSSEDIMKQIICFLVLAIFLLGLMGCVEESDQQSSSPEAQFVVLKTGGGHENGLTTNKQTKVISSQADYVAEWSAYTSATPPPVDFSSGRVLLVDMGGRSTGGYSIGITSVHVDPDSVIAKIKLIEPGSGCFVTQSITNPYQFVFIPTLKEILVSERVDVHNC